MNNLKELVIAEAHALREHATQEERERLDFDNFRPLHREGCIYGQMCFDCRSERAMKLLSLCAVPFSDMLSTFAEPQDGFNSNQFSMDGAFSPIEFYIARSNSNSATLIQFLRGERDSLTIQDL